MAPSPVSQGVPSRSGAGWRVLLCVAFILAFAFAVLPLAGASAAGTVTQPISIAVNGGGAPATGTVQGCDVSPSTIVFNGSVQDFNALPNCRVTVRVPTDGADSRYRFGQTTELTVRTCGRGTCATADKGVYLELLTTYAVVANDQAYFDPGTTMTVRGSVGANTGGRVPICTVSPVPWSGTGSCMGWVDYGLPATLPLTAASHIGGVRWDANGTRTFVSTSGGGTETQDYFRQVAEKVSFRVSAPSGAGYSAPLLSYTSLDVAAYYSMTPGSHTVWLDDGTAWSVPSSLTGSGSDERWVAAAGTSGDAAVDGVIRPLYYNQIYDTFEFSVSDATSPSPPTVSYQQFVGTSTATASASGTQEWVNAGSRVTYEAVLAGSSTTERWATRSASFSSATATAFDPLYYDQYKVTFGYSTADSSVIAPGAVIGDYFQFGTLTGHELHSGGGGAVSPGSAWVDAGTGKVQYLTAYAPEYEVTTIENATANYISETSVASMQRWALTTSPDAFAVTAPGTISEIGYYQQFLLNFSYAPVGGASPVGPTVSFTQLGVPASANATVGGTQAWVDNGSTFSYPTLTFSSGSTERWADLLPPSATVNGTASSDPTYYHQYLDTLNYTVSGGGSPSPPLVAFDAFGAATAQYAATDGSSVAWIDAGTAVTYPSSITDGVTTWTTSTTSFVASSSTTFNPTYS